MRQLRNCHSLFLVAVVVFFAVLAILFFSLQTPIVPDINEQGQIINPETTEENIKTVSDEVNDKQSFGSFYDILSVEGTHNVGKFILKAPEKDMIYNMTIEVIPPMCEAGFFDSAGNEIIDGSFFEVKKGEEKDIFLRLLQNDKIPGMVQIRIYNGSNTLIDIFRFNKDGTVS
ncbi:MAG TPA: hypothetical protein ENO01_02605 [Candidatus Marinimicrobia bacterium]|nr:hypothetical protein [Candidatus Neomarinimicrobiota bacterium]